MDSDRRVNTHVLMFGAWAALLYPGLLILGWWILAGFVPPPKPTAGADTIVETYRDNAVAIRAGMVIVMFGAVMAMPLGATVAYFIRRVEGFTGPLTMLQIMGAVGMAVLTFFPAIWWLIAMFRLDRNPEISRTLSLAFVAFGLWFPVAFSVLRRAVLRVRAQQQEEALQPV